MPKGPPVAWNHALDYRGDSPDRDDEEEQEHEKQQQERAPRNKGVVVAGARAGRSSAEPLPKTAERVTASADNCSTPKGLAKGVGVLLGNRKLVAENNAIKATNAALKQQLKRAQDAGHKLLQDRDQKIASLHKRQRTSGQAAYDQGYQQGLRDLAKRQQFEARPLPNLVPVAPPPPPPRSFTPAPPAVNQGPAVDVATITAAVVAAFQQQQFNRFGPFCSPYRRSRAGKDKAKKQTPAPKPDDKPDNKPEDKTA